MPAIQLKPKKRELNLLLAFAGILCIVSVLFPWCAFPVAILLPLFLCPLADKKQKPAAIALCIPPAVGCLIAGMAIPFSLSLLTLTGFPMAVTLRKAKKKDLQSEILLYWIAFAVGILTTLLCTMKAMDGTPSNVIADYVVDRIDASPNRTQILMALTGYGFVSTPDTGHLGLLNFTFNESFREQIYLSLHSNIVSMLASYGVVLVLNAIILPGLFTALRVTKYHGAMLFVRENGQKPPIVAIPPAFRLLSFPIGWLATVGIIVLVSDLFISSDSVFPLMFAKCAAAAFNCLFSLQGAAVLIFKMAPTPGESAWPAGLLAAFLYVCFPAALYFVGALDCIFHFRTTKKFPKQDKGGL